MIVEVCHLLVITCLTVALYLQRQALRDAEGRARTLEARNIALIRGLRNADDGASSQR